MKREVRVPEFSLAEKQIGVPAALSLKILRAIDFGKIISDSITWDDGTLEDGSE